MTALDLHAPARRETPALSFGPAPLFAGAGIAIALSLVVTLAAMALDPRLFQGDSIWLKPVKFQIALTIYLLTLAVYARWLPEGLTRRRWWRVYAAVVVAAIVLELLWISGAAMFGTASHFNREIPLMTALYAVAGVLAVIFTAATLVMGILIWRNRASGLPDALRLALGLGLVLTFVLTLVVAGTMSNSPGHFVGTPTTGAEIPIFGWSREVGDLRVAHLLATHALHFVPLAGLAAVWLLPDRTARLAVWAAAALYAGLVAATFLQALAGHPFIA